MSATSRTLWAPFGFAPGLNWLPSMYLHQIYFWEKIHCIIQYIQHEKPKTLRSSQLFQEGVLIQPNRDPPRECIVVQVPDKMFKNKLQMSAQWGGSYQRFPLTQIGLEVPNLKFRWQTHKYVNLGISTSFGVTGPVILLYDRYKISRLVKFASWSGNPPLNWLLFRYLHIRVSYLGRRHKLKRNHDNIKH